MQHLGNAGRNFGSGYCFVASYREEAVERSYCERVHRLYVLKTIERRENSVTSDSDKVPGQARSHRPQEIHNFIRGALRGITI